MKQNVEKEVRNYVKEHNNYVSSQEVVNYILHEKNIDTKENYIRKILSKVLKEIGRVRKPYGISKEIRSYVKEHNNCVSSKEVVNYILHEKNMDTTGKSIKSILSKVLQETGGVLKPYGITEEIRSYVKEHNNCVGSQEVVNYILHEKNMDTTENYIKSILSKVLQETGGVLKPYGITEEIRSYVKEHNNYVSSQEVVNYILNEKNMDTTENYIKSMLSKVLQETGGTYKK